MHSTNLIVTDPVPFPSKRKIVYSLAKVSAPSFCSSALSSPSRMREAAVVLQRLAGRDGAAPRSFARTYCDAPAGSRSHWKAWAISTHDRRMSPRLIWMASSTCSKVASSTTPRRMAACNYEPDAAVFHFQPESQGPARPSEPQSTQNRNRPHIVKRR